MASPSSAAPSTSGNWVRRHWFGIIVSLAATLFAIRCAAIMGLLRVHRIHTASMAPWALGKHYSSTCKDCRMTIRWGVETHPSDLRIVCPNCALTQVAEDPKLSNGDRVFIDRWPYWTSPIKRWDVVAFTDGDSWQVKRVVGLPGEALEFRGGDIWVDGVIQRKSLEVFREMAILVHDNTLRPRSDVPARWIGGSESDAQGESVLSAADGTAVLKYQSWLPLRDPSPPLTRTTVQPVTDIYGYNQKWSRGQLFEVRDLMIRCELRWKESGECDLILWPLPDAIRFRWDGASLTVSYREHTANVRAEEGVIAIEVGHCDLRAFVAINKLVQFEMNLSESELRDQPGEIHWTCREGQLTIAQLRLYRDVHYFGLYDQESWQPEASRRLVVIGDNVPASRDSRHRLELVEMEAVLGRVERSRRR